MKKLFLTLVATALVATSVMAEQSSLNFVSDVDVYGMTVNKTVSPTNFVTTPFVIKQDNMEVTLDKASGNGWALVYGSTTYSRGLQISAPTATPTITINIPSGYILEATLTSNGSRKVIVDGETLPKSSTGYSYTWSGKQQSITMTLADIPSGGIVAYITGLDVKYLVEDPDKQAADISFNESTVKTILGEDFISPTLNNPNNLPVIWESSNPEIVSVSEDGKLDLKNWGTVTISAKSMANDNFNEGYADYTLTVIPVAKNIAEMLQGAPDLGNEVVIDFPMVVAFAKSRYIFLKDDSGQGVQLQQTNKLSVGDVIPAGWTAQYSSTSSGTIYYTGTLPDAPYETASVIYPEVYTLTPDFNNSVLVLKNVEVTQDTPSSALGTIKINLPGNQEVSLGNYYGLPSFTPGTYDILCTVKSYLSLSKRYYYIYPIEFRTPDSENIPEFGKDIINLTNLTSSSVSQNVAIPFYVESNGSYVTFFEHSNSSDNASGFEYSKSGLYVLTGSGKFKVGTSENRKIFKVDISTSAAFTLSVDDQIVSADASNLYSWYRPENYNEDVVLFDVISTAKTRYFKNITVYYEVIPEEKDPVGIEQIESSLNSDVQYFNLQGLKVIDPEKGIYIKVENGKSSKVIIR